MYGFSAKTTIVPLNILGLLMRLLKPSAKVPYYSSSFIWSKLVLVTYSLIYTTNLFLACDGDV